MLTLIDDDELRALDAILEETIGKSFVDGCDPVFHEVEVASVNPFGDK